MPRTSGVLFIIVAFCVGLTAHADKITVSGTGLPVYEKEGDSKAAGTLKPGTSVPVGKSAVNGYRKVLVKAGGKNKIYFVKESDLQSKSQFQKTSSKGSSGPAKSISQDYILGLIGGVNYEYQFASEYTDPDGKKAKVSSLSGFVFGQYGLSFDFPVGKTTAVHSYVVMKNIAVTGSATLTDTTTTTAPTDTFYAQSFLVVGGLLKFYSSSGMSWWGIGGDYEKGTTGTIKFGAKPELTLPTTDIPVSNFIYVYGAAGYPFHLGGSFYFMPDIRIGAMANALPIILEAQVNLGFGFAL